MKIENSHVVMQSARTYYRKHEVQESLRIWSQADLSDSPDNTESPELPQDSSQDGVSSSLLMRLQNLGNVSSGLKSSISSMSGLKGSFTKSLEEIMKDPESFKAWLIKLLIEQITGIKIKDIPETSGENTGENVSEATSNAPQSLGWGVAYDRTEVYFETEQVQFASSGSVTTEDGTSISFSLGLSLSRFYFEQEEIHLRMGDAATDPLVVNFSAISAEVDGSQRIEFDLDTDGEDDDVPVLRAGSGFLVLDKNGDGVVNDGSELFGTASGDGFADLAAYDDDGNGWIDENDAVYSQLRVWTDMTVQDALATLKEVDVGAIYLGNVSTSFDLKDSENQTEGTIQKTGIYLSDSGKVGTVQHLDVVA